MIKDSTPEEINIFFKNKGKKVVTFVGYSGAEYEDKNAMLNAAENILNKLDIFETIVNIGATPEGIGEIYKIAKQMGFVTTGIISSVAKKYDAIISSCVDYVFYVEDSGWGGFIENSGQLSPTSMTMVEISDFIIAIGGGKIARDELIIAKKSGKKVLFIPAEMNHAKAIENAVKNGLPVPTNFNGEAYELNTQF